MKVIIIGNTTFSQIVCEAIHNETNDKVVAFAVNRQYIRENAILGIPVVPLEDLVDQYPPSDHKYLNTIGYAKMNQARQLLSDELETKGYKPYLFVSSAAYVDITASVEDGCIIFPSVNVGAHTLIKKGCIVFYGACITHHNNIGEYCFISSGVTIGGKTNVGDHSFIGINATIANDIAIAPCSFIGAHTYIAKNTTENSAYISETTKKIERWSAFDIIKMVK